MLDDICDWFMLRFVPKHKHHVVYTGLEPGFWDEDTRILHACMACLKRYIESMGGCDDIEKFNHELRTDNSWGDSEEVRKMNADQADRQEAAVCIYKWWTIMKPEDERRCSDLIHTLFGDKKMDFVDYVDHPGLKEWVPFEFTDEERKLEKEMRILEKKIADDEQSMLHRLINIRPSLW